MRHAFRGISRDTSVPTGYGSYDAICRNADLKHICYRLGLDLDTNELSFILSKLDDKGTSGFFSSSSLFACLTEIIQPVAPSF